MMPACGRVIAPMARSALLVVANFPRLLVEPAARVELVARVELAEPVG